MSFQEAYLSGKRNTYSAADAVQRKHIKRIEKKQELHKSAPEQTQNSEENKDSQNVLAGITFEVL